MKEIKFPLLTKDDIELRIGQISKDGSKASLLLYQDARCGMKYLDQVVGVANWQKRYYEVRGLVLCSLGIYDEDSKQWVWKDDTGTAGSIEEEKSIISDSFKRCCVCFGLARELYTAPQIWVAIKSKYDKFYVRYIAYNDSREIVALEIINENGELVYSFGTKNKAVAQTQKHSFEAPKPKSAEVPSSNVAKGSILEEDKKIILDYIGTLSGDKYKQFFEKMNIKFGVFNVSELNETQGRIIAVGIKNGK